MITFKERCGGKVWRAIEAMIVGLRAQHSISGNAVDFRTFGMYCDKGTKAYCNAATAAIQSSLQYMFGSDIENREAKVLLSDTSMNDYERFEKAIDDFSAGKIGTLFHYFGVNERMYYSLPPMDNRNWQNILPQYVKTMHYYRKTNK